MSPDVLMLSSDDDGDVVVSSASKQSPSKRKPKTKPTASRPTSSPAVAKKPPVKRAIESDDDEDMNSIKLKRAPPKRVTADESTDEDGPPTKVYKGKDKAMSPSKDKKPPAKKVKAEDGDGEAKAKPKWSYKPKAGPSNPGSKEVPEGAENCLAGLTFVFTGELSSLSREEGQDLAKRYGGRVTSAPSSKTSYVVLGSDAGPKKLEMIQKHKLKTLDEDGFLQLIGKRPSGASDPAFVKQKKKEEEKIRADAAQLGPKLDSAEYKNSLWTVKYAPNKLSEICGNKLAVERLNRWLEAWPKSLASDFKKPGPDAMGAFRCVLISGPPGIGKTTAAHLVAKLQGYNILELNASDVRSKKLLENAFRSTIENTTISGLFKTSNSKDGDEADIGLNKRSVIIMDEVDGMSAGDRGGVGALNARIRKTKVPIIAICNDKQSPKMKPLMNTCFQMGFKRPGPNEIRGRMMTVAFKEGMKIEGKVMDQLVAGSQSDIRQIVTMLSTWKLGASTLDFDEGKHLAKMNEKNAVQTPWSLYGKLFNPEAFSPVSTMTITDKLECFFGDFAIMPLFVQDNYAKANFARARGLQGAEAQLKKLELLTKAADSISEGDMMDRMIHQNQEWSLLPNHGIASCVRPASFCHGGSSSWAGFPTWFGKNSTQGKLARMLGEVQIRMRLRVSGDRREIRQSYIPTLFQKLVVPLQQRGVEAVEDVIGVMDDYFLTKEDWDAIVEMGVGDEFTEDAVLKRIQPPVKASFTRTYNKMEHPVPFHRDAGGKAVKKGAGGSAPQADFEDLVLDDVEEEEEEEEAGSDASADIAGDKLIKNKAKPKGKAAAKPKAGAKAAPKPRKSAAN